MDGAEPRELRIDDLQPAQGGDQVPARVELRKGRVRFKPALAHRLERGQLAAKGERRQVGVAHVEPPVAAQAARPGGVTRVERRQLLRSRRKAHDIVFAGGRAPGRGVDGQLHAAGKFRAGRLGFGHGHQPGQRARRVHHHAQRAPDGEVAHGHVIALEGYGRRVVEFPGPAGGQTATGEGEFRPDRRTVGHGGQENLARQVRAVERHVHRQDQPVENAGEQYRGRHGGISGIGRREQRKFPRTDGAAGGGRRRPGLGQVERPAAGHQAADEQLVAENRGEQRQLDLGRGHGQHGAIAHQSDVRQLQVVQPGGHPAERELNLRPLRQGTSGRPSLEARVEGHAESRQQQHRQHQGPEQEHATEFHAREKDTPEYPKLRARGGKSEKFQGG